MPYVIVDNFAAGLDSRRHVLNSKDGTLAVLKNAHITRGGEIEKRKAFVNYATLPDGTHGIETTGDAVYVFGSADGLTMPAGITYQRLAHPYHPTMDMTRVVYSTVYGGLPFVIAEYEDGSRFCFWDGSIVRDWFVGKLHDIANPALLAVELDDDFALDGYTCTHDGLDLTITGPVATKFDVTTKTTDPLTATVTLVQNSTSPVAGKRATGSFNISGGSETPATSSCPTSLRYINYVPKITGIYVNGNEILGVSGGFGALDKPQNGNLGDYGERLGWTICSFINDSTSWSGISCEFESYGQWSGPDPCNIHIKASIHDGPDANGWTVKFEFESNPSSAYAVGELINTSTIAASPYNAGRYIADFAGGPMHGGQRNDITSIKVDNVEILGSPVSWQGSNGTTANLVAQQINAYISTVEYTAEVYNNSSVRVTAPDGTGSEFNGRQIAVTTIGNVIVSTSLLFGGGISGNPGLPQKTKVTIGGYPPFTSRAKCSITVTDPNNANPYIFGASRVCGLQPAFTTTYKSKEYAAVGSTMYFSALNDATKWDIYDTGSGFIDMSNNFGGREDLTGFGVYQDKLAVFSRRSVQLWFLDADPAQSQQRQIIANTGCIAPDSVVSMNSIDLLYLADNGIRSLRARDYTDTAFSNDIGAPIDSIVLAHMRTLGQEQVAAAHAVVDATDGRYWLAIGDKIFVLSYFPASNISAWSTYEPGFTVDDVAAQGTRIFIRSGNTVYLYGGANGVTYDASEVVVEMPYLDAKKPGTYKRAKALDMTMDGQWKVEMGFDHTNPTAREVVARFTQSTFALGSIPVTGIGTHFGIRISSDVAGYARLSNVILHYDELQPKHEAG